MSHGDQLTVNDMGVRRTRADGTAESVTWPELDEVSVVTTNEGPFGTDLLLLLIGTGTSGCVVPSEAKGFSSLLERLFQLPGFDRAAFDTACGSSDTATFVCWQRPREESGG
jgi:hypothetical protein